MKILRKLQPPDILGPLERPEISSINFVSVLFSIFLKYYFIKILHLSSLFNDNVVYTQNVLTVVTCKTFVVDLFLSDNFQLFDQENVINPSRLILISLLRFILFCYNMFSAWGRKGFCSTRVYMYSPCPDFIAYEDSIFCN